MRRLLLRLINVFRPERAEDDLEREMAAHLALLEDEYRRRGMSEEDARFAARRALGSSAQAKDLHRDARSFIWLDDLRRDLSHGARSLTRTPGFAAVAVITLALGIGANTAIFSVISAVLLRPLPYPDADRLVQVFAPPSSNPIVAMRRREPSLYPQTFDRLRRNTSGLSHVAGYILTSATLTGQGDAVRLTGVNASASLFPTLRATPLLGRTFTEAEETNGSDAVVVLSHAAWQAYFNSDRASIGKVIALDGRGRTVVGVMPEDFAFPDRTTQFWTPYVLPSPKAGSFISPVVIARLRDGVSREAAETDVNRVLQEGQSPRRYELSGLQDELVAPVRPALQILAGAVGLVLLIACVNVANLLLVRTGARELEIALRRAIGASPGRLVRQLLTESGLLAIAGAAAGAGLAFGGVALLQMLASTLPRRDLGGGVAVPRIDEIAIDARVLLFTIGLALITGLLCGLLPALRHARPRDADVLRERAASPRVGGWLVAVEIAMAMVLLVGGGLLIHSFFKLATADRGYDSAHVLTFQAQGRPSPSPQAQAFAESLVERMAAIPGVVAAGYANNLPLVLQGFGRDVYAEPPGPGRTVRPQPGMHAISPRFIAALGLRIVEGRGFSQGEVARQEALVTRAFARSAFFDGPALGSRIYGGRSRSHPQGEEWQVVGVLEDMNQFSLQQRPNPEMFIVDFVPPPPGLGGSYFAVRTSLDASSLTASVRGIVRELDPAATVDNIATMDQIVSNAMSQPRLYAVLVGLFAAVAVALAAIGIYGVLGFIVTQRTREIGIRVALGARPGQVMTLILRQTALLTTAGVTAGVIGAALFSRYLEGLLFGVTPLDAATFAAVIALFVAIAALASYLPARRATQIEPQVALRAE